MKLAIARGRPRSREAMTSSASVTWLAWALVLVFASSCLVEARFDVISVESGSRLISLGSGFGFTAGGTLNISIDVKPSYNYKFLSLFNNYQWRTAMTEDSDRSCTHPADMRYEFKGSLNLSVTVNNLSFYRIVLINCDRDVLYIQGNASFANQGERGQMSLDEIILFPVYCIVCVAFVIIAVGVVAFYYKHRSKMMLVYKLVIASVVCKCLEAALNVIYYANYETTGDTFGSLRTTKEFAKTACETFLLAVIVLVALGWKIMRTHLTIRENQLLYGACILFAMFDLLFSLCRYPQNLCSAYMLSFHVVKFLITFGVIVAMNGSIERLRADALEQENPSSVSIQFFPRVSLYQSYRWFSLFYLLAPIGLVFIEFAVLDWIEYWLVVIIQQFIYGVVLLYTVHIMRPSKQQVFFVFLNVDNSPNNPLANLPQYTGDYEDDEDHDQSLFSIFFNNVDSDDDEGGFSLRNILPFINRASSSNLLSRDDESNPNIQSTNDSANETNSATNEDETTTDATTGSFGSLAQALGDDRNTDNRTTLDDDDDEEEEEEEEAMITSRQRRRQAAALLSSIPTSAVETNSSDNFESVDL